MAFKTYTWKCWGDRARWITLQYIILLYCTIIACVHTDGRIREIRTRLVSAAGVEKQSRQHWRGARWCIVLQIKTALLKTAAVYTGYTRSVTVTEIDVAAPRIYIRILFALCKWEAHAANRVFPNHRRENGTDFSDNRPDGPDISG